MTNPYLPFLSTDFNVVIDQDKKCIREGLSGTILDDDVKSIIFEYVQHPLQHLGASFRYRHKSTGIVVYDHPLEGKCKIAKCDGCSWFFNQEIEELRYLDPGIIDWFPVPKMQCSVCKINLCKDCGGDLWYGNTKYNNKLTPCMDRRCRKREGLLGLVSARGTGVFCHEGCGGNRKMRCNNHQYCADCSSLSSECQIACYRGEIRYPMECSGDFCSKTFKSCPDEFHKSCSAEYLKDIQKLYNGDQDVPG